MSSFFDNMARALGSGMSRRQALRRVGGLFAGAALGAVGLGGRASGDTLNNCNTFCKKYPAMKDFLACRSKCLTCSTAAQTCGSPASGFTCVNFQTDNNNCGSCNTACFTSVQICSSGTCVNCGVIGQPCCSGSTCLPGGVCNGGICQMPMCFGQPCGNLPEGIGGSCPPGCTCVAGSCLSGGS